jgi:CheY-like chemotaxis protein
MAENLPRLAVQPTTTRQTLLSMISAAIRSVPGGDIRIEAQVRDWHVHITVNPVKHQDAPSPAYQGDADSLQMAQRLARLSGGSLQIMAGDGDERPFSAELVLPVLGQVPVLAIDDNTDTLQLLRRYLSGTRYRFVAVRDPNEALTVAGEAAAQIIVLDVMLPGVDGWELLGRLREHPKTRDVPIIVCTILPEEELALTLGAASFIRKPVSRGAFLWALDRQLALLMRESH